MTDNKVRSYRFNSFLLDVNERQLSGEAGKVALTPKVFDVLVCLVTHGGHLVHKDELMQAVWPDSFVDEVNLPRAIHTLRKILGDDGNGNKFIETVPTKGYRFVADIKETNENGSEIRPAEAVGIVQAPVDAPLIRDAGSDGSAVQSFAVAEASTRSRAVFVLGALVGILVIGSAAGFWFFKGTSAGESVSHRVTAETFSGEAYQYYHQGRLLIERRYPDDYPKAREFFDKAIALDPNYSAAYAARADVKITAFWLSSSHDDISGARTDARKAIELDPSNSYAHAVLCRILTTYDWDHKEAEKECRRGVELDPNDPEAQKELAFLLRSLGREDEALAAMDKAIAIAPTSFNKRSRGMILYEFGRYDEAIAQLEQVEETDPLFYEAVRWLMRAYEMKRDHPRALECYIRLKRGGGGTDEDAAAIRATYDTTGWPGVLERMAGDRDLGTLFRAGAYAQLGAKDKAFATLEDMFRRRTVLLITIAQEPTLEPLRSDPRFDDLLKRIGLK